MLGWIGSDPILHQQPPNWLLGAFRAVPIPIHVLGCLTADVLSCHAVNLHFPSIVCPPTSAPFSTSLSIRGHASPCQWRDVDKVKLLNRLRRGKTNGFQADSGWKPQIWNYCAADLAGTPGAEKTAAKCKDHCQIKKSFAEVHAICNLSGFGWDEGLKMVTATLDVWDKTSRASSRPVQGPSTPVPRRKLCRNSAPSCRLVPKRLRQLPPCAELPVHRPLAGLAGSSIPTTPHTPMHQNMSFPSSSSPPPDDLLASSPPSMAQKRAASASPEKPSGRRNRKPRNADVGTDIASALRDVAGSLTVVGSPEVWMRAVQQLEEDDEFSDEESATIGMRLVTLDSAVAQTYTASKKKSMRTAYVRGSVEAAQRKGIL
ncbi:hypothetical protein B0H13DRAFT_1931871 [Mycena leptocephala]|nr:hypothetical protein B0H13DRAFT_1931871 [Mycena leptocephala]